MRHIRVLVATLVLSTGLAAWLPGQRLLYTVPLPGSGLWPATMAIDLGDTNMDGIPDILVLSPKVLPSRPGSSRADVLSGTTTLCCVIENTLTASAARLDDLDGDGTPDFAIAGPDGMIASCARGKFRTMPSDYVARIDDTDGDGASEYAVALQGVVTIHSGRTGVALVSVGASSRGLGRVSDADGDGIADLAVFAGTSVEVRSGRDLTLITVASGGTSGFGGTVIDDIDSDGFEDFLIANPLFNNTAGRITVISMWNGVLYTIDGAPGEALGWVLAVSIR